jgi:hypothetical protein
VTGLTVPFRPLFYAHLALLHAALVVRVGSDLLGWTEGRQWGGLGTVVALLVFLANTALAVITHRRATAAARPRVEPAAH